MSFISKFCNTDYESYEDFYNNFSIKVPENFNYGFDVIGELAKIRPDSKALIWRNDKGERKIFTFADIDRLSNRLANFLMEKGIKKGDYIMLLLKRHYMYWISMIALHKIGAVAIPATHMLTVKDLVYRIESADVKMILCADDPHLMANIDEAHKKTADILKIKSSVSGYEGYLSMIDGMDASLDDFPRPTGEMATKNDDEFLIYFTSGTTGMPKMVTHTYTYPLGHIITAKFWHDLNENDISLAFADSGWAKCSWGKMYGQWMSEACIFVYDYDSRFMPIDLIHMISEHKITVFCAPPTIYRFLIREDLSHFDLSSLRHCCTAGEPLNPEVFNRWKKITGIEIKEGFGQSETAVLIGTFPWVAPKPGSTGRPSPHFNIQIIDENGEESSIGDVGEICIDVKQGIPAGLTVGYHKDEKRTEALFAGGYYHTGDMAWKDEDGYIWFEGRADDVIKCSGYRIGPFEVESALLEHDAVLEAAVTAVPDPIRGQIVKATVVLVKNGKYQPSNELIIELQTYVKDVTAPYKYPRIIEFVEELPKTISGKIKRAEIRKQDNL